MGLFSIISSHKLAQQQALVAELNNQIKQLQDSLNNVELSRLASEELKSHIDDIATEQSALSSLLFKTVHSVNDIHNLVSHNAEALGAERSRLKDSEATFDQITVIIQQVSSSLRQIDSRAIETGKNRIQ